MKSGKVRADNNDAASEDATEEAEEIENTISAPQSGSGNVQNHHRTHIQHHHVPTMAIATVTTINGNTTIGGGGGDEEFDFDDEYWNDEDDEALLYFKTPHQLLDIFAELEENNLALIQNCQETEETLEELKQKIVETESQMEKETLSLTQQIEFLNSAIAREEEKARQLEERAKMFSTGLVGVESQEKLLEDLNHKVKDVYRRCIGDSDANLDTLQMLTNIENKLEQLFEVIENMPKDKVEQAEKTKDKERRRRQREEKMETQRALQEKRVQIALERAKAPVKKKVGKPVVFRSAPPQKKKKKEETKKVKRSKKH